MATRSLAMGTDQTGVRNRNHRRLKWVSAVWLVLLVIGSMLPLHAKMAIGTIGPAHDAVHVAAFASTAVILMLWANSKVQELGLATAVFAIGVLIEMAQKLLSGDVLESADIRADFLGVLIGLTCLQFRSIRESLESLLHKS